jgi:predicted phosphoribosyltransferase
VGILSGLVLLPLAPVRGTIWVAEQLAAQAERELDEEVVVRRLLLEAERELEEGAISEAEFDEIEDALLDRLEQARATEEMR